MNLVLPRCKEIHAKAFRRYCAADLVLLLVVGFSGCANSPDIPGSALGSNKLKIETLERIKFIDKSAAPDCPHRRVINTELPGTIFGPGMRWEENWYIDRCGTTVPYNVHYIVSNNVVQLDLVKPYPANPFSKSEYVTGLAERNQCSSPEVPRLLSRDGKVETYGVTCEGKEIEFKCKFPEPLTWPAVQRSHSCWRTK